MSLFGQIGIGLFTLDYPLLSILVLVDSTKKFIVFVTECNVRRFNAANTIFELYKAVYLAKGASRLTSGHESFRKGFGKVFPHVKISDFTLDNTKACWLLDSHL